MFTLNGINDDIKMIESLVNKNKENVSVEDFERFFGFMEYLKKDIKNLYDCYEYSENKYFDLYQMLCKERRWQQ